MARLSGNRWMWLLKGTSKHATPERLAWAVALGTLAGLVPKANLLAVALYALILFLPVHTLLAIGTSLLVWGGSFYLDPISDRLGEMLLTQPMLAWLWTTLDEAPVLPWLALNNTVVLGCLVIGLACLAPTYMVSLRLFEFLEYDFGRPANEYNYSSVPTEQTPLVAPSKMDVPQRRKSGQITLDPPLPNERRGDRRIAREVMPAPGQADQADNRIADPSVIVPPPKFVQRSQRTGEHSFAPIIMDEPIEFEPIEEVRSIINAWHMGQASGQQAKVDALSDAPRPSAKAQAAASVSAPPSAKRQASSINSTAHAPGTDQPSPAEDLASGNAADASIDPTDGAIIDRIRSGTAQLALGHDYYPESTWRGDVMSTMEVVQNASETLAWVDELLDECLADHGITVVASDLHGDWDRPLRVGDGEDSLSQPTPSDASHAQGESASRWLMETTIEIVRWADNIEPNAEASQPQTNSVAPNNFGKDSEKPFQPTLMTRETAISSGSAELTILPMSGGIKRNHDSSNPSGFQHLVMADATRQAEPAPKSAEPVKGECLGYLLGHLRQAREGKSS